jgi:hypothetical protein
VPWCTYLSPMARTAHAAHDANVHADQLAKRSSPAVQRRIVPGAMYHRSS